jgi:bifunctional DNA-binding transcriptional regulator/antitoxin component of YhaV-PrlF toxin-antitoxin module
MTLRCRLTDDWIPIPDAVLRRLGWSEGDHLEVEVSGDALIISRASDQTNPPKPGARVKSRPLSFTPAPPK